MTYLFFKDKFFFINSNKYKFFSINVYPVIFLINDVYKKLHKIELLINLIYSCYVLGGKRYRDVREKNMEQFEENVYIIDLSNINNVTDIIFELSSALDSEEAKNKRICLKLGNISLNQAQLLSIKSLINGIESTLSSIDTKSVETEKVALSLGIIVSNISNENLVEITPEMTYKTVEEFKEEQDNKENNIQENTEQEIVETISDTEPANIQEETEEQENNDCTKIEEQEQLEETVEDKNQTEEINISQEEVTKDTNQEEYPENNTSNEENEMSGSDKKAENNTDEKKEVYDELDAIFTSSPAQNTFLEMEATQSQYEEKEALTDIFIPEPEYTKEDIELESFPTKYIKQTIRSGQVINYEGNVVIIGDCHPGCEITAFGDITVWGVLGGIAHAGAGGNQKARVRALKMNAIQLRIANCYSRRPDHIETIFAEKTNSFTPEEARIVNNEIVVFKIND